MPQGGPALPLDAELGVDPADVAATAPGAAGSTDAFDIAVVDISLKGCNGIELMKNIKARFPDLPLLVLSMHDESLYAERALRAGEWPVGHHAREILR